MTIATKLREQLADLREHSINTWRAMAKGLADGNGPRPKDLLEVAAALDVANPGEALEADAQAYRERKSCEAAIDSCREKVREQLKPFGGRVETLRAAAEKADIEARRLRDLLEDVVSSGQEGYWLGRVSRLERENPRAFGEWPKPRPKFDLEDISDD